MQNMNKKDILLVLPVCLPLLDKGGHALPPVLSGEGRVEEFLFRRKALVQGVLIGSVGSLEMTSCLLTTISIANAKAHVHHLQSLLWHLYYSA